MSSVKEDLQIGFNLEVGTSGKPYRKMWIRDGRLYCRFGDKNSGEVKEIRRIVAMTGSHYINESKCFDVALNDPVPENIIGY